MIKELYTKKQETKGFTLIELIIVITIIGILSGVLISVINPVNIYNKGKYARAEAEIDQLISAITLAQTQTGLRLGNITGDWCTRCVVCNNTDLRDSTGDCYNAWITSRDAISASIIGQVDLSNLDRDPWGSPYILDENEGEFPTNPCVSDRIGTVGPDGYIGTSDDRVFIIPFMNCH